MNLQPIFKKLHPENSYGGQCGVFAHLLVDFPNVGNLLYQKTKAVSSFGTVVKDLTGFREGDVLITKESYLFGHVAVVNWVVGDYLQLTESNYYGNLKVTHGRKILKSSNQIIGVIRGSFKFELPPVEYPMQIPVTILLNNQPFWNSLLQHMANLQWWFWENSQGKIQLSINYRNVNFNNLPIVYTGGSMEVSKVPIIEDGYFKKNILPPDAGKITLFVVPKNAFDNSVFNMPGYIEWGFCYKGNPMGAMIVSDEHDDYPPYYPKLGAFAKVAAHEIIHGLYDWCVNSDTVCNGRTYKLPPGTDLTHYWFYSEMKPEAVFEDFDYKKLNQIINP